MKKILALLVLFGGIGFAMAKPQSVAVESGQAKPVQIKPVQVVAAENFYGQVASEVGGKHVVVKSIMNSTMGDPHLFTLTPSAVKLVNSAQILIYNGGHFDEWMEPLLPNLLKKKNKDGTHQALVISVLDLMEKNKDIKLNGNPHIWYHPETFPRLAQHFAKQLKDFYTNDPKISADIDANLKKFLAENKQVSILIDEIKTKHKNISVTATEPVFGYMSNALGFKMEGSDFQWKIMNHSEPTPKMIQAHQNLLKNKQVKLFFYNPQVRSQLTDNMLKLAKQHSIQTVETDETLPNKTTVNQWLIGILNNIKAKLEQPA